MKVLIVDDNHDVIETIMDYLTLEGIIADCAYHGESAINLIQQNHYDVIIMDIMMPKLDGINTVKKLREEIYCNTPIIFLTAKDSLQDKIDSFTSGGDDFLNKPFAMEELCLRLHSLHNRGPRLDVGTLRFSDISLNLQTHQVTRAGKEIKLSKIQRTILSLLLKHAPAIVSKEQLVDTVWGDDAPSSDSLRSHIYSLRSALDKGFSDSKLETIHGQGYRLIP
ncbi:response regulator transcription factor [Shewanella sp. SM20]|uniref:response regulator transcription factor n=1 Tax=unclassified Shewanella TaxID=196818 RepID=UPI0021DA3312|nr:MULTISPECIES: response regulator transcription factor [unclassified Shewanella]MCU8069457.1 response regulator transcription factor [Shewanella sp. SM32]MCU8091338.1 response regulator transcription factor [Shewanella sp. SM20]